MSRYLPGLESIAREAGTLLMGHFASHVTIEYKGEVDLVTVADRSSEELIVGRLRERWPEHGIVAEEGTRSEIGADYRWYVDPLDGTTNFAHGYPVFCISIALARHDGQLEVGVLYDPTRDEMFSAERGAGANLNGKPMRVSKMPRLAECLLGTGFPSHKRHKNPNIHFYHQLTLRSHGVRRAGSAALDLACVACGRYDGFWEFNLNPWDTSAGVLLVQEAGGRVTRFDGSPFRLDSREVLASNGLIHSELITNFEEIFAGRGLEELPSVAEYVKARD
ncbi:MAG TPA: inositol monophosphatase family protein [Terriglobales bacterium]|nr:inositol monophosphatase family protein [Terriglobales bacterium]